MNYAIFKRVDDYEKLLNKIFNDHVKIKDKFTFIKVHGHQEDVERQ